MLPSPLVYVDNYFFKEKEKKLPTHFIRLDKPIW